MSITEAGESPGWLLLAASLPGSGAAAARVHLWRSLRDAGAASLRDGVSVLPCSGGTLAKLTDIVAQVEKAGGSTWLFTLPAQVPAFERRLRALFDRRSEYQDLKAAIGALRKQLAGLDEASARKRVRQVERDFQAIAERDYFPGREQSAVQNALAQLRASIDRRFSPAEPSQGEGTVALRDRKLFQRQRWATRKRLWVDRVASAWLIRRHIDTEAEFQWLERPKDCPADSYGFDFNGATFTHVGDLVTFEVLLKSFDLSGDAGLDGLARLVHYLDVGGDIVAEAAGFEALLFGLREGCADDDALLAAATPVLDALYRHYAKGAP
jgi:hypothetical protein